MSTWPVLLAGELSYALKLDETASAEWMLNFERFLRYGGTPNEYEMRHGRRPLRRLTLIELGGT